MNCNCRCTKCKVVLYPLELVVAEHTALMSPLHLEVARQEVVVVEGCHLDFIEDLELDFHHSQAWSRSWPSWAWQYHC